MRGELVRIVFLHKEGEATRFGVAVSKKIANSPERSRGKRVLRESIRRLAPHVANGAWIVASLRERGLDASARDIWRDMADVLMKARLLSSVPDEGSWCSA